MHYDRFRSCGYAQFLRFAAAAAVAAALIAAAASLAPAGANNLSLNPAAEFQRIGPDGQVAEGLYYAANDPDYVNVVRISFRTSFRPPNVEPGTLPTYLDFGRLDLFFENEAGTNLHPSDAVSDWWVTANGGDLTQCNFPDWHRCYLSKADYQALAGQTGAPDSAIIQPITIGFKVPNSVTAEKITFRVRHTTSIANRPGARTIWTSSEWTRINPNAVLVTPLNADGEPTPDEFVFSNAAGNLGANIQHARLSVGAGHIPGFTSPTYASWGTASNVGIRILLFDRPNGEAGRFNLAGGQINSVFFRSDGTTALPCASGELAQRCYLVKSAWQELAGQTGAEDTETIKPIRIAFKVPTQSSGGTADEGNVVELQISRIHSTTPNTFTYVPYSRLTAHVHRYQSAKSDANGVRSPHNPPTDPLGTGETHSGLPCGITHGSNSDCSRNPEVGERLYVAQGLSAGGDPNSAGLYNHAGSSSLKYGPEHFDEFEVSFVPANANPGDAILMHNNLCPVELPADGPEHPYADAPRDRTAAELRVCTFDWNYFAADRFRTVDNPGGADYGDAGTGPGVFGTKAGAGRIAAKYYKYYGSTRVLVAENSFPITFDAPTEDPHTSGADALPITAELGQHAAGDSLTLLIGYPRGTAIPYRWSRSLKIGGPGYIGPARYEDVTSVALTVPAGGGQLQLLGTEHSCTAADEACTLTLDRAALQDGARYGLTSAQTSGVLADTAPIWPSSLRLRHASAADVTIAGVLTLADGTTTVSFNYTAKAAPATNPLIRARPREDADGILAPGQTAPIAVGYQIPADDVWSDTDSTSDGTFEYPEYIFGPASTNNIPDPIITILTYRLADGLSASLHLRFQTPGLPAAVRGTVRAIPQRQSDWTWQSYSTGGTDFDINPGALVWHGSDTPPVSVRYSPVPSTWVVDSYLRTVDVVARSTDVDRAQLADMGDSSYLQITGPATWTDTGGRRLRLDRAYSGKTYDHLTCIDSSALASGLEGRTCYVTDSEGNAPSVTVDSDASGDITFTASLPIWQSIGVRPAWGLRGSVVTNGNSRPANTHAVRLFEAFGSARVGVESINQLTGISLDRKPNANGIVPTTPIRIGSTGSEIRLALRNANGRPSQLSAVSAITITVIGGGTLSGLGCTNASSCSILTASGPLFDAVKANPAATSQIDLQYNAPSRAGKVSIRATVVGANGATFPETLDLVISGNARELATGGELLRVHSSATDGDDRDKILIPVTATDGSGNAAPLPLNAAVTVRQADGTALPAASHTAAVKCEDVANPPRLKCNVEIIVTASASDPLDSGAYTAEVTGSGIGRTELSFAVGGPAAAVALAVPDVLPGLAQTFTATASAVDAAGVPVADGTWIVFDTTATGGGSPSSVVTSPGEETVDHDGDAETAAVRQRRAQTKNGQASANVTVVGNGVAVLTAATGFGPTLKSANEALDTRTAAAPGAGAAAGAVARVLDYSTPDAEPATGALATYRGDATTAADVLLGHAEAPADASIVWLWNGVEWIRYGETADGGPIPGSRSFFILPSDTVWFGG